jgi:hypothetical protein
MLEVALLGFVALKSVTDESIMMKIREGMILSSPILVPCFISEP